MATTTYTADRTALLIVDPYNDFMSEGGSSTRRRGRRPKRSAFTTTCASWIPGMRPLPSMLEGMHAAHEINGPRFAHAMLTTEELLTLLPDHSRNENQEVHR